ncbi:MAG: FecR family protein [Leptospirales bacterium]|nr:FecR family protein [Leptospirales bacterium]
MKHNIKIAILIIFLVTPSLGYSMKINFFIGTSTLIRDGKSISIKVGDIVSNGDIIKTSKDGVVEIIYDDGSKITIQSNSEVKIGDKNIKSSNDVTIISGVLVAKFIKSSKGENKIASPTTICGVRGTDFTVAVSKGGDSKVELTDGKLNVRNSYGSVNLNKGFSAETDLAGKPVRGRNDNNIDKWENKKNSSLDGNINDRVKKYGDHVDNFNKKSESNSKDLEGLRDASINASSKKDFAESGEKIVRMESDIEESMLMNDASKRSIENIMNDYADKNADISNKFKDLADKCNTVHEQQLKNYEAIQNIKEEYKKEYDKIMNKFKDDKTEIFKSLEDFKKNKI